MDENQLALYATVAGIGYVVGLAAGCLASADEESQRETDKELSQKFPVLVEREEYQSPFRAASSGIAVAYHTLVGGINTIGAASEGGNPLEAAVSTVIGLASTIAGIYTPQALEGICNLASKAFRSSQDIMVD